MRNAFLLALVGASWLNMTPALLASGLVISFEDLPKIVGEKNENFRAARLSIEAQEQRKGHFARSFLPQVSASIGEEDFKMSSGLNGRQTNWRLGAFVNLYRGGRDFIDENIRSVQVDAAKIDSKRTFHQELQLARVAFWDVVAIDKLLLIRREELIKNKENIRSAKLRAGSGLTSKADANQFELYKMELEKRIKQLLHRADIGRNRLAIVLGISDHENLVINGDFRKQKPEETISLQVENQLDVRAIRNKARIDNLRANQAASWWHPEVDLFANYGVPSLREDLTPTIRNDRETIIGVRMNFDFGQGLNDLAETRAKNQESASNDLRAAYRAREVTATDHEIRHDMKLTIELLSDNERSIVKAREFLKTTQAEYARGIKNGPDLLAAFRQHYDLRDRAVELHREILTAQAELEFLIGKEAPL